MDEAQDASIAANFTRVQDLWFADHGLVLQAEDRLFRVSGGILSARSSVFRDMLAIPQSKSRAQIDGCPVVVLDDSGMDAEYFLRAIFDASFFERPPASTTLPTVAGVLKLSTKYGVEFLRRRALLHLSTALAGSLDEWDETRSTATFHAPGCQFLCLLLVDSLALTWAIPAAMYAASCSPVLEILDGVPCEETHVRLPPVLQRACLVARAALAVNQHHDIYRFLRASAVDGCRAPDVCPRRRLAMLDIYSGITQVNPLILLTSSLWADTAGLLCEACCSRAEAEHREARQAIWDSLPVLFDLPSWEQLHAARTADL
ncbi:hypothetical protein B0H15DRAFT_871064, partial [Mycena belliarum]